MRQYSHDYVWGTQDRRRMPDPPGSFLIDAAACAVRWVAARRTAR